MGMLQGLYFATIPDGRNLTLLLVEEEGNPLLLAFAAGAQVKLSPDEIHYAQTEWPEINWAALVAPEEGQT